MRSETKTGAWIAGSRTDSADRSRLLFARLLADLLDQQFTIPGTSIRIGLDPLLGLIPGIGDAVSARFSNFTAIRAWDLSPLEPPLELCRVFAIAKT